MRLKRCGAAGVAVVIIGVLAVNPASAQTGQFDVSGTVADSTGIRLQRAMVVALTRPDSVLTKFATTDGNGAFTLSRLPAGEYILQVTSVGYMPFRRDFVVTDGDVDAGTITLAMLTHELEAIVVSAEHVPFVNRHDTLDYNVAAFPTRPNATVEELLQRLPGIEVEADGSIKAQGEDVRNVLVDGKEFFGSDPTIATRNLPAEAVERVQVYDKQSDMAEFTGIADGHEERTINLQLREGARHGYFGRVAGALGADGGAMGVSDTPGEDHTLYDERLSINRFSPTTQLAGIANVNNVSQAGFSWEDYQNFMGGGGGRGGGAQIGGGRDDGITETMALGVNVSRDLGEDRWIRSSYFLSSLENVQDRDVKRQQLLGSEVSSLLNQTGNQTTDNFTHRLNLNAQYAFAEGHDLRLRGDLNASSSSLSSVEFQETRNLTGVILNSAATDYAVEGDDFTGSALITWRKRLSESGRSIIAEVRANLNDPDLSGTLSSTTGKRDQGDALTYDEIVQEQSRFGHTLTHSQRLSLTQPFSGGRRVLELFGERRAVDEAQTKSVYDSAGGTSVLNDLLSSEFERTYTYLQGGMRFDLNTENSWLVLGLEVQNSDLNGKIVDRDEQITNGYTHILPSMDYRIQFEPGRNLNLRYRTSTREPTMTELQPFSDNTNPLNVYTGNPDLTPAYTHTVSAEYRFYDEFSFANVLFSARASYTTNDIVRSRNVDASGLQQVTSVNSGGAWSTNGSMNYGRPIRSLGARINLNYNLTYSVESEFINQAENVSRILRNTVDLSVENRDKQRYDLEAGGRITFNTVRYSLNEELNQSYANSSYYARGTYYLGDSWTFNSSLDYRVFDRDVFGSAQNVAMLQASVSRLLLGERAELELSGFDLLNQNQGIDFTSSSNFIQETRIVSLGQFAMLRFIYHLRPGGGRGLGGRGGRERRR
jgi:hypothetical protein